MCIDSYCKTVRTVQNSIQLLQCILILVPCTTLAYMTKHANVFESIKNININSNIETGKVPPE